jgi:hypothetical protein
LIRLVRGQALYLTETKHYYCLLIYTVYDEPQLNPPANFKDDLCMPRYRSSAAEHWQHLHRHSRKNGDFLPTTITVVVASTGFLVQFWHKATLWCVEKYLRMELVGFLVYMYQQSWFLLPKQWPAQSKQLLQYKYDSSVSFLVSSEILSKEMGG